jgi:hypothetical protein
MSKHEQMGRRIEKDIKKMEEYLNSKAVGRRDFKHDEAGRRIEKIKTTKVELKTQSGWKKMSKHEEFRIRHYIKGTNESLKR